MFTAVPGSQTVRGMARSREHGVMGRIAPMGGYFHTMTGTVEMLLAGAPSISLRLIAR